MKRYALSFASVVCCYVAAVLALVGCNVSRNSSEQASEVVFEEGCYPQATLWQGHYYYTMQQPDADCVVLYEADRLEDLAKGRTRTVLKADSLHHIWSPELHRLAGKWYLYFEADDGNTDNHQLYVLENTSEDPTGIEMLERSV